MLTRMGNREDLLAGALECLKDKGDWKAVARNSPEWNKAKLDHDRANLRKAVGKLSDMPTDEP